MHLTAMHLTAMHLTAMYLTAAYRVTVAALLALPPIAAVPMAASPKQVSAGWRATATKLRRAPPWVPRSPWFELPAPGRLALGRPARAVRSTRLSRHAGRTTTASVPGAPAVQAAPAAARVRPPTTMAELARRLLRLALE